MARKKRALSPEQTREIPVGAKRLQLVWRSDEEPEATFSDNLHVRRINEQIYLTFGQVIPPHDLETLKAGEVGRAEIRKVARIVVTLPTLKKIVKILEENPALLADA